MKTQYEVEHMIKDYLLNNFRLKEEEIVNEANIKKDLLLDSLDAFDIISYLETELNYTLINESKYLEDTKSMQEAFDGTFHDLIVTATDIINKREIEHGRT